MPLHFYLTSSRLRANIAKPKLNIVFYFDTIQDKPKSESCLPMYLPTWPTCTYFPSKGCSYQKMSILHK
jgi:hypothetical protein